MNVLFDLTHPKDVHLFKNLIFELEKLNHKTIVVARNRPPVHELLCSYKIKFVDRGKGGSNVISKVTYLIKGVFVVYKTALKYRPDVLISAMSPYVPLASKIISKPSLFWDDTEHAIIHKYLTYPFCTKIFTPQCYRTNINTKHFRFNSILELAYLHPEKFVADRKIVEECGIKTSEKYIIIRFVAWNAHHDIGHRGISTENKIKAIKAFSEYAKVYITSETNLPEELVKYQIQIPPENMHHVLAFASMYFGESATMAAEASVLGVPSIYLDNNGRGYTDELEKFGLTINYSESENDQLAAIESGLNILKQNNPELYRKRLTHFLEKNVDLTNEMLKEVLKYDPDFKK